MKIFYFTSTGNGLALAKEIGGELYSIPQALKGKQFEFEDDEIGIVFPCYYFGAPSIVEEFLCKVKLKADYIYAIMSYGNISAGALCEFNKIAKEKGIKISYLNEILMVDNYLPIYNMDRQIAKEPAKQIEKNLSKIISDIKERKQYIKKTCFCKKIFSVFAQKMHAVFVNGNVDKRFRVESSCNACGICEKVCPVDNIKMNDKPEFSHHCIECLACTHNCPQNSIRVKWERSRTRFINKNVSVNEIIKANK
ncbi:MAG: EFR1 family ferrodoxin [Victivallales bacterium]|nr:EFR1 family ferrodoxin [Victivallales bacterium]